MAVAKKAVKKTAAKKAVKTPAAKNIELAWSHSGDTEIGSGRFKSIEELTKDVAANGMDDGDEIEIWQLVQVSKVRTTINLEEVK